MRKQIISPGQAVLLLISFYKKQKGVDHNATLKKLKTLYLDGVKNPDEHAELRRFFDAHQGGVLAKYKIVSDAEVINSDPTRRYFETHLAYEVLKHETSMINVDSLSYYSRDLENYLKHYDPDCYSECRYVLAGEFNPDDFGFDDDPGCYHEYSDYITRLKNGELFKNFSKSQKLVIELMIRVSLLAVSCARSGAIYEQDPMPLDIYGTELYSQEQRGKRLWVTTAQESPNHSGNTRSQHLGLMKNYMALARNDIAMATSVIPFLKGSDQATYRLNASWPKLNFSRLMHPFSNSISGSVLCQLRALAYFYNNQQQNYFGISHEDFQTFFKLYIATILYYNGGHSLFEFVAPLSLNAISEGFPETNIRFSDFTIAKMFISDSDALDNALDKAIAYNNQYLSKKELHAELKLYFFFDKRKRDEEPQASDKREEVQEPLDKKQRQQQPPLDNARAYDPRVLDEMKMH